MTIKEFKEIIEKDVELQKKYEEAKETFKNEGVKDKSELLSKVASKLGFDIPASEFQLEKIGNKELNDDELDAVTGGMCGATCEGDFTDTDCWFEDSCDMIINHYTLKTCLYNFSESCNLEDACDESHVKYECGYDYTGVHPGSIDIGGCFGHVYHNHN